MTIRLFFSTSLIATASIISSCKGKLSTDVTSGGTSVCSDNCRAKNQSTEFVCSLTTPELQARKATVLASLKRQIMEKKELPDGYAFKFAGTDEVLDELLEFIKTERTCCNFFVFNVSVSGDKSEIWLALTGVEGVKDVITNELEL